MDFVAILTSAPVLALLGYAAFVVVLQLALQPMRLRMVDSAEEMLAEEHWNKEQRADINAMLDGSSSFAFSVVLPLAALVSILKDVIGVRRETTVSMKRLEADPRYHALIRRCFISILGTNPIAAVVTIPLIALKMLAVSLRPRAGHGRAEAVEEPVTMVAQGRRFA